MLCLISILLFLGASNSYVLLTANVEDMHAVVKELAASPLAQQFTNILRRASTLFNIELNQKKNLNEDIPQQPINKNDQSVYLVSSSNEAPDFDRIQTRRAINDVVELGKNASLSLKALNKQLKTRVF